MDGHSPCRIPIAYEANSGGSAARTLPAHTCSDDIESARLGGQIALKVPEEPKLTYRENFSLTISFSDGTTGRI